MQNNYVPIENVKNERVNHIIFDSCVDVNTNFIPIDNFYLYTVWYSETSKKPQRQFDSTCNYVMTVTSNSITIVDGSMFDFLL